MSSITDLTATELTAALTARTVGAEETARAYLDVIAKRDPDLHVFNEVWREAAIERARMVDATPIAQISPLAGLPIALKDNLCTLRGHTTCSSRILEGYRAPYQATVVARLEEAGVNILGKTNMDEFAMGSSTENSRTGPTRNPWDTERVPGGSSGGSAAAVAARLAPIALGSDTGGSIRQPAAFCGVVGLKPTYGRVSRFGLVAYGSSLDQIGPLARDVRDCALLLGSIAGSDPRDSTSVDQTVPDYLAHIERPIAELRVGVVREFMSDALDREIRSTLEKAQEHFAGAGAQIVEVSLPHSRIDTGEDGKLSSFAVACYYIIAMAEASSNLSRYDGVHYGHRTAEPVQDIIELYSKSRSEGFGEEVQRRIMLGTFALSSGYYDAYYLKALRVRRLIKEDFDRAFSECDLLLTPVSPTPPFRIGENTADPLTMYLQDVYTLSLNLAGLPGLALPCGMTAGGLPIGMQLVGPVFSEDLLLRAGRMFELASGLTHLTPPGIVSGREGAAR